MFSEYKENFDINYNNISKKWILKIRKLLDEEDPKNEVLVTTITALKTGGSDSGKAVLLLKLPNKDTEGGPEFSNSAYTGEYRQDDNKKFIVELSEKIVVKNTEISDKIIVTLIKAGMYRLAIY